MDNLPVHTNGTIRVQYGNKNERLGLLLLLC
jgi:hypothetical protein